MESVIRVLVNAGFLVKAQENNGIINVWLHNRTIRREEIIHLLLNQFDFSNILFEEDIINVTGGVAIV